MKTIIATVLISLSLPVYAEQTFDAVPSIEVCHTLESDDCALPIIARINSAQQSVWVEAYNYTEPRIIAAVIDAKKRGLDVRGVFDKISPSQKGEGVQPMYDAGIPVYIDRKPKIAHNKTIVVDGRYTVGGSFNYSTNADTANAENVTIIDDPRVAQVYGDYINERIKQSVVFTGGGK
jgi:phosphatidylserine/phosphatidylglycerophosphate/cardiolipin synthase-like enzyme